MGGITNTLKDILKDTIDLSQVVEDISPIRILVSMFITLICSLIIYSVYKYFYRGAVYNENFNVLLVMTSLTTAFIITTISSNLVLSLGMVGALSIVRFRAAIKDPLDIGFLFWAISIGLTTGAKLYHVAIIGTVVIALVYIMFSFIRGGKRTYLLVVKYSDNAKEQVKEITSKTKNIFKSCSKRNDINELTLQVKIKNDTNLVDELSEIEGVQDAVLVEFVGD